MTERVTFDVAKNYQVLLIAGGALDLIYILLCGYFVYYNFPFTLLFKSGLGSCGQLRTAYYRAMAFCNLLKLNCQLSWNLVIFSFSSRDEADIDEIMELTFVLPVSLVFWGFAYFSITRNMAGCARFFYFLSAVEFVYILFRAIRMSLMDIHPIYGYLRKCTYFCCFASTCTLVTILILAPLIRKNFSERLETMLSCGDTEEAMEMSRMETSGSQHSL